MLSPVYRGAVEKKAILKHKHRGSLCLRSCFCVSVSVCVLVFRRYAESLMVKATGGPCAITT